MSFPDNGATKDKSSMWMFQKPKSSNAKEVQGGSSRQNGNYFIFKQKKTVIFL